MYAPRWIRFVRVAGPLHSKRHTTEGKKAAMPMKERTSSKVILNLTRRGVVVGLFRTVHRRWPFLIGAKINTSRSLSSTISNTQRRFIIEACHIYRASGQYQAISVGQVEHTFENFLSVPIIPILSFRHRFSLQNPL